MVTSPATGASGAQKGRTAFLFPGQGSQSLGMGAKMAAAFDLCRTTFEEADDALGFPLSKMCFDGPESELTLTANTQPAILTVSVAIARLLASRGLSPDLAAGHSLGEYSALVAANVLSFPDAVRAVRLRGLAMQDAVPAGQGAMAAILGLAPEIVEEICLASAQGEVVSPANFNAPDQTVVAGHAAAVERASRLAVARGAMRAVPLAVSAPFHCSLMRPAERRLAEHLAAIRFEDPRLPVVANVDALPLTSGDGARDALIRQVCSPVRWVATIHRLREMGAGRFIEVGPGKVLTGLMRRIDRSAEARSIEDPGSLEAVLRAPIADRPSSALPDDAREGPRDAEAASRKETA